MGAPDVLARLAAVGVRLRREADRIIATPKDAITDEARALIRAHKAELLDALDALADPAAEARRQRVRAMLAERPGIKYALIPEDQVDPEAVILALAIRRAMQDGSTVTCELRIPREKYDPFLLLDLIERHGAIVH
jgi:hypothetical protein